MSDIEFVLHWLDTDYADYFEECNRNYERPESFETWMTRKAKEAKKNLQ